VKTGGAGAGEFIHGGFGMRGGGVTERLRSSASWIERSSESSSSSLRSGSLTGNRLRMRAIKSGSGFAIGDPPRTSELLAAVSIRTGERLRTVLVENVLRIGGANGVLVFSCRAFELV
jgi:hypothetical protein